MSEPTPINTVRPVRFTLNPEHFEWVKKTLTELKNLGVTRISWHFSGGGDEGTIDAADVEMLANARRPRSDYLDGLVADDNSMINAIIGSTGIDWWNSDGGAGDFVINVTERTVRLDIGVNETVLQMQAPRLAKF